MPILIEDLSAIVISLVLFILLATGVLIALTIVRRQRREKYFQRIDELRAQLGPVIAGVLAGKIEYQKGLALLEGISGLDRDYVLEQLAMSREPTAAEVPILRQLCEDLGLVRIWQRQLAGRFDRASIRDALSRPEGVLQRVGRLSFLLRARSAEYLGTIRHQPSWPLLVKALDDPHPDVQGVAVRALAVIAEPQSFSALVNRMNEAVLNPGSRISLRSVKSALVNFPLRQAAGLLPCLKHAHRRIRFLATDIIREMVERKAAAEEDFVLPPAVWVPELTEIFLTRLCFDENPDVRARAAPVVAYVADTRSAPLLLTLLDDSQWFVRLHTLRALAKRKYLPYAAEISRLLTDPHWMVREAAARALLVFGRVGADQLSIHFLNTRDRYSREQIADEMQRAGLIPTLLAQYAEGASRETEVVGLLAQMGKTSYLLALLEASPDRGLRKKFLENFGRNADPQIKAWVRQLARQETDAELRGLAQSSAGASERRGGA